MRRTPGKFTAPVVQRILDAKRRCETDGAAAQAGGIDRTTLAKWLARGRYGYEPYASFFAAFRRADRDGAEAMRAALREAVAPFHSARRS